MKNSLTTFFSTIKKGFSDSTKGDVNRFIYLQNVVNVVDGEALLFTVVEALKSPPVSRGRGSRRVAVHVESARAEAPLLQQQVV